MITAIVATVVVVALVMLLVLRLTSRLLLRIVAGLAVAVAVYFGVTFVQVWAVSHRNDPVRSQAIIVLGAAQYNGRPSPALANRLAHGYALWKQQLAPIIVTTGGRQPGDRYTEATTGYDYLRAQGVPDAAILKEVTGGSTYESLSAAATFLAPRHISKVILVSDDYHNERLLAIAHEVHLDATVSPAPDHRSTLGELHQLGRETVAVGVGRIVGFRRLDNR